MPTATFPLSLHDPLPISVAPTADDLRFFTRHCGVCHGATGAGDGPRAAELERKPPSFTDPHWQSSITDSQILHVIERGGRLERSEEHTSELQSPCNLVCRPPPSLSPYTTLFRSPWRRRPMI